MSFSCYHILSLSFLANILSSLLAFLRNYWSLKPLKLELFDDSPIDLEKPYHHAQYLDPETGAFPRSPLPHLPAPFHVYEDILAIVNCPLSPLSLGEDKSDEAIARRPAGEKWRRQVRALSVQDFTPLKDDRPVLQRAHVVLAWLVHFYIHSTPPPPNKVIVVPATLARPLVQVSGWLQIAPVLTYADTVLWNFELYDDEKPFSPNNMRFTTRFNASTSADTDEAEFYRCCAWIEQRGFDCTKLITDLLRDLDSPPLPQGESDATHHALIAEHLNGLVPVVSDLTDILMSVRHSCRPNAFYSAIRPWYRGSDSEGDGLRWIYEGVENSEHLELSGPSAGQTSTFHVLDALLGVQHNERSRPFMERMLMYMPSEQRRLLRHLQHESHRIRGLVGESEEVRKAYNAVLEAMTKFRTDHLQVAVRYVVSPKDKCPITGLSASNVDANDCPAIRMKSRGTGGNEVSTVLKGSRDSTRSMKV
ncbi:hypothetical protein FRB99_001157 [Tulasnella sp. 403]|nr:hypothetical protein FRB99_001157 [Tulasnella sp. 403]